MVSELLLTGAKNAQTGRELCKLLNINARDLTERIERERRDGQPICASVGNNPGYYLAADQTEMQNYCNSLFHRAGEIHKTRKACLALMDQLPVGGDYGEC
jgi:hypothetical protein